MDNNEYKMNLITFELVESVYFDVLEFGDF